MWARSAGGVWLLGVFGASIQLGIALALLVGGGLADISVDWRVELVINALLGAVAFAAIPRDDASAEVRRQRTRGFVRLAVRRARVYRLALLYIALGGVPLIPSAWLIEYLSRDGNAATALASLAALLFGLSAVVRVFGAQLQRHGVPHALLGGSLGLAAIGMAGLAFDPVAGVAFASIVLLALGFGIPYVTSLSEAQDLYPDSPSEPVALPILVGLIPPIVLTPIVGHAIARDSGELAFGLLAAFVALATFANLRRTGILLNGSVRG